MKAKEFIIESKNRKIISKKLSDIESRKKSPEERAADYRTHVKRLKELEKEYVKQNPDAIFKVDEAKKSVPKLNKPRDPNYQTLTNKGTSGASGTHKDRKAAEKRGESKHKQEPAYHETVSHHQR